MNKPLPATEAPPIGTRWLLVTLIGLGGLISLLAAAPTSADPQSPPSNTFVGCGSASTGKPGQYVAVELGTSGLDCAQARVVATDYAAGADVATRHGFICHASSRGEAGPSGELVGVFCDDPEGRSISWTSCVRKAVSWVTGADPGVIPGGCGLRPDASFTD
jgi:hypothetical protein